MINHYKNLGLSNTASISDIKKAFRSLAKSTHPDLNGGDTTKTEQFRKIAEAYTILSDPEQKRIYDEHLKNQNGDDYSTSNFGYAEATASDIEMYIHIIQEQASPYIKDAKFSIFIGLFWLIVGFAGYITTADAGEGRYIIMCGAMIYYGGIKFFRSLDVYKKINAELKKIEKEMRNN